MKNLFKKLSLITLTVLSLSIVSCDKDDATGDSTLEVVPGVTGTIALVSPLSATQIVKEAEEGLYSFTVTLDKPQSVNVVVSVVQDSGTATENDDFEFTHDIVIPAYSTTGSGTIHILSDDLEEGDEVFALRIGNANTSNASVSSKTVSFTIKDCFSDLAGDYAYVTTNCSAPTGEMAAGPLTGTVTFTAEGGGIYLLSDASFGGWIGLYGAGNIATGVKFTDLCGVMAYAGVDQFNEVFTFSNLVINGNKMSFRWENDYGEFGFTELTNPNGNWPNLTL